jgi:hypothetical protein
MFGHQSVTFGVAASAAAQTVDDIQYHPTNNHFIAALQHLESGIITQAPESLIGAAAAVACTHQPQAACPILAQPAINYHAL